MTAASDEPQAMAKTRSEPVPVDVYIQFVRSLFDNAHHVAHRRVLPLLVAFMVYWSDREPIYLARWLACCCRGMWRYSACANTRIGEIANA